MCYTPVYVILLLFAIPTGRAACVISQTSWRQRVRPSTAADGVTAPARRRSSRRHRTNEHLPAYGGAAANAGLYLLFKCKSVCVCMCPCICLCNRRHRTNEHLPADGGAAANAGLYLLFKCMSVCVCVCAHAYVCAAGAIAQTSTYPLTVVRRRMQVSIYYLNV